MNKILIGVILLFLLFPFSCRRVDSSLAEKVNVLKEQGVLIDFSQMQRVSKGKNCVSKYVLLVYLDSTDCTTCALGHMYKWDELLAKYAEKKNYLQILFIFLPKKSFDVAKLQEISLQYPLYSVWIDSCGTFERNNPSIVEDPSLHVFLLNSEGNLLLVGNPSNNERIRNLFNKVLD